MYPIFDFGYLNRSDVPTPSVAAWGSQLRRVIRCSGGVYAATTVTNEIARFYCSKRTKKNL